MLGTLLTFSFIGLVVMITALEILRYRSPKHQIDGFVYSRKRLSRRIGVNLLLIVIVLMIYFKPEGLLPLTELVWLTTCLAAGVLIMILVIRDLRETSAAVVREHQQFLSDAEQEMLSSIPEIQARNAAKQGKKKGK